MTKRRFDSRDTPFGQWFRNNKNLASALGFDYQDIDHIFPLDYEEDEVTDPHKFYISHQFLHGQLMIIEEKQYKAERTMSQRDTFGVLDQWFQYASGMQINREIDGRPEIVNYWGWFTIQFEKTGPMDGRIWINGKIASLRELEQLMLFNRKTANRFKQEDD